MKTKPESNYKNMVELLPSDEYDMDIKLTKTVNKVQQDAAKLKIQQKINTTKFESISGGIYQLEVVSYNEKKKLILVKLRDKYGYPHSVTGQSLTDSIFIKL